MHPHRSRRRIRTALGLALGLCAATMVPPGLAAGGGPVALPPTASPVTPPSVNPPEDIGALAADQPLLTFAGGVTNPTPFPLVNEPIAVVCEPATCQEFAFTATDSTPFLVSIKDTVASISNGWDLAVYDPSDRAIAAANGIGANGQAVLIDTPQPGRYVIVVTFTYAEDPGASYTGEVRALVSSVWSPAAATCNITVGTVTGCFSLPVLRAEPAADLHVVGLPPVASTPLGFPLPLDAPTSSSCYVDEAYSLTHPSLESVNNPVTRCLRFTSNVINVGSAPLDIGVSWLATDPALESGFAPGGCHAVQSVRSTTGDVATRPAGDCEFHPAHAHFHYRDLVSFTLYALDGGGGVGAPAASSLKESFCLADDDYAGFGSAGPNGPRNYVGQPDCNVPARVGSDAIAVDMGVSPGWGDVYTWDTPDQFIDISTVAPGVYDLIERTNPSNTLLVAGAAQTCSLTQLQLTADTVSTLSTQASVPCPAE